MLYICLVYKSWRFGVMIRDFCEYLQYLYDRSFWMHIVGKLTSPLLIMFGGRWAVIGDHLEIGWILPNTKFKMGHCRLISLTMGENDRRARCWSSYDIDIASGRDQQQSSFLSIDSIDDDEPKVMLLVLPHLHPRFQSLSSVCGCNQLHWYCGSHNVILSMETHSVLGHVP